MVEPAEPAVAVGSSIKTEWYSTWQTNDPIHNNGWATEIIGIERNKDHFTFENKYNDLKYSWGGKGEIHQNYYMSGIWKSKQDNPSAGSFMLHIADSQGRMRTGFLLGPNTGDRKNFGAWVLVKKDKDVPDEATAVGQLEIAKKLLAASMCPGLGELVKYSGGQFIEEFLHSAIASAHQLLKSGYPQGAVKEAFGKLEQYVKEKATVIDQNWSSFTNLNMVDLMANAFEPGRPAEGGKPAKKPGPLSNSSDPPQGQFESSSRSRMQDLFKGSLYIRNSYAHSDPPPTTVSDAVVLLMMANYFFGLVDSQVKKRATSQHP